MIGWGKVFQDFTFGLGNIFQAAQQLQMGVPTLVITAASGRASFSWPESGPGPAFPFPLRQIRVVLDGEQGLGQADFVVEVGLGLDDPVLGGQAGANQVLGGGFPLEPVMAITVTFGLLSR